MSQQVFRVGDLALMQYANYFTETDGELGIVTAPLALRRGYDLHLMEFAWVHVYRVKVLNGTDLTLLCRPWQLRKLDSGCDSRCSKRVCSRDQSRKVALSCREIRNIHRNIGRTRKRPLV